jgi:two-component system CheB/CheR fusion protein
MKTKRKARPPRGAARRSKAGGPTTLSAQPSAPSPTWFPIVGIGASAGGLEALEQFIGNVPPDSGMALVIVQHLDPTQKGILPELLQRATVMKVIQVRDRIWVRPDCVYVIPPNKNMSLLRGALHLLEPEMPRGQRLPIDFFFRSLAQDRRDRSVGVILTGMGTDGTLGLRAIKEHAGLVVVQDPATARFDAMPRSAIDAGLADIVAPVDELPGKILLFLRGCPSIARAEAKSDVRTQSALEKAVILLRAHTGHDFTHYKQNTICRRIERRMGLHRIGRMAAYVKFLQSNPQELDLLFKELLIGVTNFFRDAKAWDQLGTEALPALLASRTPGQTLRAWVPGCSTGEEAYSLAISLREAVEKLEPRKPFTLQIFATDLEKDSIDRARLGLYPHNIAADVTPEQLRRFFVREERGYRVRKEIREMVIFAAQNLIMDPPFTKLDILSCRNVLIYLSSEVQKKLIPLFHFSLNPGGILFLGGAEAADGHTNLFTPLGGKSRLFRRSESLLRHEPVEFPASFGPPLSTSVEVRPTAKPPPSLQALADQTVLQRFAPPAVLVSHRGDVVYVCGRTGKYLEPAAGKANWNVFAMAREGLRYELSRAFQKSLQTDAPVSVHGLTLSTDGGKQMVDITLQRLAEPGPLQGMVMIVFTDVATPPPSTELGRVHRPHGSHRRSTELERELQRVRAESLTTHAEMQNTQEELRSANEELTTSKEEMQSMNEELQTLNAELQAKVDELSRAGSDVRNLLDSTDIAALFLDRDLNVRRFTAQATSLI